MRKIKCYRVLGLPCLIGIGRFCARKGGTMSEADHQGISRCPCCGGEHLAWPTPRNFQCNDCGFVLYLNIAAAVGVIMECRGKLLFGVRKHDPGRGMLDLAGGFVDAGESGEEAARREVREELGIELPELRYLFSFPNRYPFRGMVYDTLDLIFLVRWDQPPLVTAADDLADVVWVDRDAVEFDRIAFDSLRRAVRRYLSESRTSHREDSP